MTASSGKCSSSSAFCRVKDVILLLLGLATAALGLKMMFFAELNVVPSAEALKAVEGFSGMVLSGLKPYFLGGGLVLLVSAVLYILIDKEEDLSTRP